MRASNPETIYSAGFGDWTQARLITVSESARTVTMSHRDKHAHYLKKKFPDRLKFGVGGNRCHPTTTPVHTVTAAICCRITARTEVLHCQCVTWRVMMLRGN